MNWLGILKNQQVLPTRTSNLALILSDDKDFEKLLGQVESAEALSIQGVKAVTSLKNKSDFIKNQFVQIYSQREGTDIEQMWANMERLLEAIEPKLGRKRESRREKIISASKSPEKYEEFIAQLKENPLTEDEIRRLESVKAKEAYRKIVKLPSARIFRIISALEEEDLLDEFIEELKETPLTAKEYQYLNQELKEKYDVAMQEAMQDEKKPYEAPKEEIQGYTLRFNFKAGEGVSKREFENALDLLASSEKITRSGNDLVFDTDRAEGVRQLLMSDSRFRPAYDNSLRGFMQRLPKSEQITLPKTTLTASLSESLLTDKRYSPKSDLRRADFTNYLEVIAKSNVPVAKYLPLSRGQGEGIADEVYLASGRTPTLSPYGNLVLMSDFGDNWKEDFFGNVKLSSVFSRKNAEQAVITDILETLKSIPESQRMTAELYGTISLAPFANIDLEKKTEKKSATQTARDAILKVIRGSASLTDMFASQSSKKQRNMLGQMQNDSSLLTILEAKAAEKRMGGKILYYDSSLKELESSDLIASSALYARLEKDGKFVNREELPEEDFSENEAQMVRQIQSLLDNPTDESTLADIVFGLIDENKIQNVLRRGGKNRLEQANVENGLIFLLEMAEQYGDSSLKEALDKAVLLGTASREQFREMDSNKRTVRREVEEALDAIDENMPKTLETYKTGMLEALSVKLAEIGQNYEKFVGQNPQGIETVIRNLLNQGLLEE
jgi:hypothetical protein